MNSFILSFPFLSLLSQFSLILSICVFHIHLESYSFTIFWIVKHTDRQTLIKPAELEAVNKDESGKTEKDEGREREKDEGRKDLAHESSSSKRR